MQKKKILEVEIPEPEQEDDWRIAGTVKKIKNTMHFIGDIYHDGECVARLAINKEEYAIFDVGESRWVRQTPWYSYYNTITQTIDWGKMVCDQQTREKIAFFTKSKGNPGEALWDRIKDIWNKETRERAAKEEAKEQKDLDLTPDIPADFEEWARSLFEDVENIMFYKRDTRTTARVRCGVCGKEKTYQTSEYNEPMSIQPPRADGIHMCGKCGAVGVYKQAGRIKRDMWTRMAYLFQNTRDGGMVIRMFEIVREQEQGYAEFYRLKEIMRAYINRFKVQQYYWHRDYYRAGEGFWSRCNPGGWNRTVSFKNGKIYPGWNEIICQSEYFKYCDVELYQDIAGWGTLTTLDIISILKAYARMPQIELMAKMGLRKLTREAVRYEGAWNTVNKRAKDAAGFLKIEKHRLKNMGDMDIYRLMILQYEKKSGIRLDEEMIEIMTACHLLWNWEKEMMRITRFMSLKKALNRIRTYAQKEYGGAINRARIEYADYLGIREELGYDMTNSVYLHPRDLKASHQEMVEERQRREDDAHIKKMLEKYQKIATRYEGLCKKYRYEKDGFLIRPAKDAEEIVMEGRLLHHCVGGENYLSKHNDGTTSILFLRKQEEQDTPYITIEIRGTEIIQWYGIHDTKPDKEEMQKVIDTYVDYLKSKHKQRKMEQQIAIQVQQTLQRAVG